MKLCLRWLYQTNSKEYEQILNQKNCDEDTPLIIACINKSNLVVKTILDFGMADIYSTNSKKLTAYQIALSSSNEEALQMLMKYEVKVKKKNFINKEALN
jgi:ankyrin repeat protein